MPLSQGTRLGRQVAVKVLPDAFAQDPERLARFEREARNVATGPNVMPDRVVTGTAAASPDVVAPTSNTALFDAFHA